MPEHPPGNRGERELQDRLESGDRAAKFYSEQLLDHLTSRMIEFVQRQEMAFIATADSRGECDSSFRAGSPGFIRVIDERTIAYPEYRGNGVMASMGNVVENPHIGIMLVDFVRDLIGLHINGKAYVVEDHLLRTVFPDLPMEQNRRKVQCWVVVDVKEAYIHCRKHIPRMIPAPVDRAWHTDDTTAKGGDYFAAKTAPRPAETALEFAGASSGTVEEVVDQTPGGAVFE